MIFVTTYCRLSLLECNNATTRCRPPVSELIYKIGHYIKLKYQTYLKYSVSSKVHTTFIAAVFTVGLCLQCTWWTMTLPWSSNIHFHFSNWSLSIWTWIFSFTKLWYFILSASSTTYVSTVFLKYIQVQHYKISMNYESILKWQDGKICFSQEWDNAHL